MNKRDFNELTRDLSAYSQEIIDKKGPEYTQESLDVLHNFKATAERLNISSLKVWSIFFDKQVQSIMSHVNNPALDKAESLDSRFADIINYCYLGYALFVEREIVENNDKQFISDKFKEFKR